MNYHLIAGINTKNITCLKCYNPCCFILSVQFLRKWKYLEINNGQNMLGSYMVLIANQHFLYLCFIPRSSYKQTLVSLYPQPPKEITNKKPILLYWNSQNTQPLHHVDGIIQAALNHLHVRTSLVTVLILVNCCFHFQVIDLAYSETPSLPTRLSFDWKYFQIN